MNIPSLRVPPVVALLVVACDPIAQPAPASPGAPVAASVAQPGAPTATSTGTASAVPAASITASSPTATATATSSASQATKPLPARCKVTGQGKVTYTGRCDFRREGKDGSFSVTPLDQPAMSGATVVSLSVTAPGVAEVRGLTAEGINSRWGEARRSTSDRACWEGAGFAVCAYAVDLEPGVPGSAGPPAPKAVRQQHGGTYWAVYTATGATMEAPEVKASIAALKARGLELGSTFGFGSLGCDVGAATALGGKDDTNAIGVYFATEADARAFAATVTPKAMGVARIKAMCRD